MPEKLTTFLLIGFFSLLTFSGSSAEANEEQTQMIIHLLDYIARDYSAAVEDGMIINAGEYQEMREFGSAVNSLVISTTEKYQLKDQNFLERVIQLEILIQKKARQTVVATLAQKIKQDLIRFTGYQISPLQWPEISRGKKLYSKHCMVCHGVNGEGKADLLSEMNPPPTNFRSGHMAQVSPFQIYNTIKLGIEGTAMRAFPEIEEQEA